MSGQSAKTLAALLIFLSLPTSSAHAKQWNFDTGSIFGLGLVGGVNQNPGSDFVTKPITTSASFSHFFGFEPFLDFGNFILRFSGKLQSYPVFSGSGSAAQGQFTETSDIGSGIYGVHLLLSPYISENKTRRGFIKLGYSQGIAKGKNVRTFANGARYTEKIEARTSEMLLGIGFEFFLVQNYSMQIESGYRQSEYEKAEHVEGTDVNGVAKNKGDPVLNSAGGAKKFNDSGVYASVGLNLHF